MFLVMGITGKVGGATAEHLLAHGKEVRALDKGDERGPFRPRPTTAFDDFRPLSRGFGI